MIFALSVALTSPLMKLVGGETGGFHIHGLSSRGKTTVLQVAASIWGNAAAPTNTIGASFVKTWRATGNSLEGIAACHNDCFLPIDELGQVDSNDFQRIVYDLSSGVGKTRMRRDASLVKPQRWTIQYLSTGEVSAKSKMEAFGKKAKAGVLTRLIDIPIDTEVFQDTHGLTGAEFADSLKHNCSTHYGWAGPAFVEELIEIANEPDGIHDMEINYLDFVDQLTLPNLEAEQNRVIKRLALVLLAGAYAVDFGILPLEEEEVIEAIKSIRDIWLNSTTELNDCKRAINDIIDFLSSHESQFHDDDSNYDAPSYIAGYKKEIKGVTYYLFTTDSFNKAIQGANSRATLRELDKLRLLFRNNGDRMQARVKIASANTPEATKLPFYAISSAILDLNDETPAEPPVRDLSSGKKPKIRAKKRKDVA
jgi:uncharacterized protein (DUF927 family)